MSDIERIISQISDLPSSRATFFRILNLYQNPLADFTELEKIIKNDIGLTTKVLKLVNSSYYGLRNKVTNIDIAVRLLGIGTIKSIALAATVFDFVGFEHLVNKDGLWLHMWMVGYLSKSIAALVGYVDVDSIFLAGILHDVGKLILSKYLPLEYKLVLARLEAEDIDEIAVEQECLGFTHAQLGARVLESWRFPQNIVYLVEHHHLAFENITEPALKIIYISNYLANKYGYTFIKNKIISTEIDVTKILNIATEKLENIINDCKSNLPELS